MLHPMPGYVLVELGSKYKHVTAATKSYEGATSGVVVESVTGLLKGDEVFWSELVAGNPIRQNDKSYVFVRIDRIEGYLDAK